MRWREVKKGLRKPTAPKKEPLFKSDGIFARVKSFIIDMFMIYTPILYILAYLFYGGAENFRESHSAHIIALALFVGIDTLLNGSSSLKTPGKKAYEQSVVDIESGERIGYMRYFLRAVIFLLSNSVLLGFLVPFYRHDKRGLHDILTHSVVIKKED